MDRATGIRRAESGPRGARSSEVHQNTPPTWTRKDVRHSGDAAARGSRPSDRGHVARRTLSCCTSRFSRSRSQRPALSTAPHLVHEVLADLRVGIDDRRAGVRLEEEPTLRSPLKRQASTVRPATKVVSCRRRRWSLASSNRRIPRPRLAGLPPFCATSRRSRHSRPR